MTMALVAKARSLWAEFSGISAGTYASSIAYYSFMSIVPLLAIIISLVSVVGIGQEEVCEFFHTLAPKALYAFVDSLVGDAYDRSGLAFSLSSITLLWSASKGVRALRSGLNVAYATDENRSAPRVMAISFAAVVALGLLLAAAMYLVFSDSVIRFLAQVIPGLEGHDAILTTVDAMVTLAAGIFALALCYAYLAAGRRRLFSQLPGAACAAVACGVLSFGFRVYVDHIGDYTVLYGSLATVTIFLLWMFLVFYALLAGGFINRYIAQKAAPPNPREP